MVKIVPFNGIIYDVNKIDDIKNVITQPYDKISNQLQEEYYQASPYNIIRIEKGKPTAQDNDQANVYTRAHDTFEDWLKANILIKTKEPALFYLEQEYEIDNVRKIRKGLIAMGKLEEYANGVIFPHEQTLKGPKIDRLNLFRSTKANFGQIFLLYSDKQKQVTSAIEKVKSAEYFSFTDPDGVINRLFIINDKQTITEIEKLMADKQLFIADGHHRYETALAFKKEMNDKFPNSDANSAFNFCMMTMINMDDEGLTILPTHRLVKNIPNFNSSDLLSKIGQYFEIDKLDNKLSTQEIINKLYSQAKPSFVFLSADSADKYLLEVKDVNQIPALKSHSQVTRNLDVAILHDSILEPMLGIDKKALADQSYLDYRRSAQSCIDMINKKQYQALFLLRPTKAQEVRDVALERETMPQKSTDFYPKILTGYVIADISEKIVLKN